MPVGFDSAQVSSGTGTSLNHNHTFPAGAANAAFCWVHADTIPDPSPGLSLTVGGNAATLVLEKGIIIGTGFRYVSLWRFLLGATSGSLAMAVSNLPASVQKAFITYALTGVHQVTPHGTAQFLESSATTSSIVVPSAVGGLVISGISIDGGSVDGSVTTVNLTRPTNGKGPGTSFSSSTGYAAGAASVTADWSWTGSQPHSHIALPINATAAALSPSIFRPPTRFFPRSY